MKRSLWLLPVLTFTVFSFEIALTRIFGYLRHGYRSHRGGLEASPLHSWALLLLGGTFAAVYLVLLLTASPTGLVAAAALVFLICGALVSSLYEGRTGLCLRLQRGGRRAGSASESGSYVALPGPTAEATAAGGP
jgi:hypothetical protein